MCEYNVVTVCWIQQEISPSLVYLNYYTKIGFLCQMKEMREGREWKKALCVHRRYPQNMSLFTIGVACILWGGEYRKAALSATIHLVL